MNNNNGRFTVESWEHGMVGKWSDLWFSIMVIEMKTLLVVNFSNGPFLFNLMFSLWLMSLINNDSLSTGMSCLLCLVLSYLLVIKCPFYQLIPKDQLNYLCWILFLVVLLCCCFRFRIPRTKQEIEADYQRRKIVKKFRKRIQKFENAEMDGEMDLKKGNRIQSGNRKTRWPLTFENSVPFQQLWRRFVQISIKISINHQIIAVKVMMKVIMMMILLIIQNALVLRRRSCIWCTKRIN